jgi:hypothetical protein
MKSKLIAVGGFALLLFARDFSVNLVSNEGTELSSIFSTTHAQSLAGEEGSGGPKTEWFYFDCEYVQGKYCSSVSSDSSCGKSKTKPLGAC